MSKGKERKQCKTCGQLLPKTYKQESVEEVSLEVQEAIIAEIKEKATKATMLAIKPLLEKLEEASKQQSSSMSRLNNVSLSSEDQIKQMQKTANEKMQMRQMKVQEKTKNLQTKISRKV